MKYAVKTASQARKDFFELLAAAKYGGQVTLITKNGKAAAKIMPGDTQDVDWIQVKKIMNTLADIFTDADTKILTEVRESVQVIDRSW